MDTEDLNAWLRLTLTPGVGNVAACALLRAFGGPQAVFLQSMSALQQVVSPAQARALRSVPPGLSDLLRTTLAWLQQSDHESTHRKIVSLADADYPAALLSIDDPPLMLYLMGAATFVPNHPALPLNQASLATDFASNLTPHAIIMDPDRSLAVVGSRNPTPQGESNARLFSKALSQAGLTIVSGMALGIDAAAHLGALDNLDNTEPRALTLAVVGTGLDRVYPRVHRDLAHQIADHGMIVSEYPLGTPPLPANFPKRNRLIAALTRGTLVVEATLRSGSLVTARMSAELGRDVFAVPGSIHAVQSRGCHALIKQGAKLVESAQDILDELALTDAKPLSTALAMKATVSTQDSMDLIALCAETTSVSGQSDCDLLPAMGFDPLGLDALQVRTGLDAAALQVHLMTLELSGQIARLPGGLFVRLAQA